METSFQNMVDSEYSGKAQGGMFGITPGAIPPHWTLDGLAHELMGEYITQPLNKRAEWKESDTQVLGIINQTVLMYAQIMGGIAHKVYQNTTPEWDAWVASNNA